MIEKHISQKWKQNNVHGIHVFGSLILDMNINEMK
jgi:hypothetical protein